MKRILCAAMAAFTLLVMSCAMPVHAQIATSPTTQNTVTTTGPVTSETKISVGSLAGDLLNWLMLAFGGPIGGLIVLILVRVLKKLGIDATDALRARLKDMVVNSLNIGVKEAQTRLAGQGAVDIKNEALKNAVAYVQSHGADTIKALGLDPQSGDAVQAIRAQIATAIADPTVPTPAVLGPPATPQAPPPLNGR